MEYFVCIPSFITFEDVYFFYWLKPKVFAFFFRSKLGLGAENKIYDINITDDKFVVVVDISENSNEDEINTIKNHLNEAGAQLIEVGEN